LLLLLSVVRWFKFIALKVKGLGGEGGASLEVVEDLDVLLIRTLHVLPLHELADVLGQGACFLHVDVAVGQAAGTTLIDKVKILNEQAEERNNHPLLLVCSIFRSSDCGLQGGSIGDKVGGGVDLVAEHRKLAAVDFRPGAPQPGHWRHVEAGDDSHHGVEVADVDTLPGDLDPELYRPRSVFFLFVGAHTGSNEKGEPIKPGNIGFKVACLFASS